MNIGLVDCDKTNYPNLALMKLSSYHKAKGDNVEWVTGFNYYNKIYISKVFDETYSQYSDGFMFADEIIRGGTGYGLDNKLPDEVEHTKPDTSLYGIKDTAYGFLTRGCPLDNKGNSCLLDRSVWNIWEIERRLMEAENEN